PAGPQLRFASHVGDERLRDAHAPVTLLEVLHDGDDRPRARHRGAVERVHELHGPAVSPAEPDIEAARLKVRAVAARLGLPVAPPPGHPRLDVVLARRGIPEVAGGDVDDAVGEPERLPEALLQRSEVAVLLP